MLDQPRFAVIYIYDILRTSNLPGSLEEIRLDFRSRTDYTMDVSYVAMKPSCERNNWDETPKSFSSNLLSLGVIPKGIKDELYATIMPTLEHFKDAEEAVPDTDDNDGVAKGTTVTIRRLRRTFVSSLRVSRAHCSLVSVIIRR